jgi:cytochrome c oxidase subunit IV
MSVETEERGAAGPAEPDHEAHQHSHPSDSTYIKVAVILAVLTAAEVATYFIKDPSTTVLVALLFPMMIIKFVAVCFVFMHLRFDNPLFRRVFIFGLVLAVGVYAAMLTSMQFWSSDFGSGT